MSDDGVLFVSYRDTLELLGVAETMRVCEKVFRMQGRGAIQYSDPMSLALDERARFHNRWNVKGALLSEIPVTGISFYNYYDDGVRNTVGGLDCTRYTVLSDPETGEPLAIVDPHWSYAVRSAACAVLACKWLGPTGRDAGVLGLNGVGTMGTNALRCLVTLYDFTAIACTSRRPETRAAFAARWSRELAIPVTPCESVEQVARQADLIVGGTTLTDVVCREDWVKPGATFISLARRELDPAGWAKMDKVVIDSWDMNMLQPPFADMVAAGQFSRDRLHGEIHQVVSGAVPGRERAEERILIHTCGLAAFDLALAHLLYERAREEGLGVWLPRAEAPAGSGAAG